MFNNVLFLYLSISCIRIAFYSDVSVLQDALEILAYLEENISPHSYINQTRPVTGVV